MKTTLLQLTGIATLVVSAVFAVLMLRAGEHHLIRWLPIIIVVVGLAVLEAFLREKGPHK